MTDTERAVIEAAEKCRDANRTVDLDNAMCVLIDAVDAHRAAPKLVQCRATYRCGSTRCLHRVPHTYNEECETDGCADWPNYKREPCSPEPVEEDRTISTVLDRLSKMPKADFDKALAEHRNGFYARLVDGGIVPEREVRRREREAFCAGLNWYLSDDVPEAREAPKEAAKRYPDTDAEPNEPDPQRGPVNVNADAYAGIFTGPEDITRGMVGWNGTITRAMANVLAKRIEDRVVARIRSGK